MPVEAGVFGKQQRAQEQRRNVAQGDEVGGWWRLTDGSVGCRAVIGAVNDFAAQAHDRGRHLAWRPELDLLAYGERGGVRRPSVYPQLDRGRAKVTAAAG